MSGLDEQLQDFPPCPNCDDWEYWYVVNDEKCEEDLPLGGLCLNPDSYFKKMSYGSYKINDAIRRGLAEEDLDNITDIRCDNCDYRISEIDTYHFIQVAKRHLYTTRE